MQIAVIAEYNPFHLGHEAMLCRLREHFGKDAVLSVILGGTFSQRGEPYITTPYVRASAAVRGGANLVVELPFPYACAPANTFARAGVEIAKALGADVLAFGSECADTDKLQTAAERTDSAAFQAELARRLAASPEAGALRLAAALYRERFGEELPSHANDRLAMAYLRALCGSGIRPHAVPREAFPSATAIRCAEAPLAESVPPYAYALYADAENKGLFGADRERLAAATLLALCNGTAKTEPQKRLSAAAATARSLNTLLSAAATKAYTNAELSRAATHALFGVTAAAWEEPVRVVRLFAADARGCAVLRGVRGVEVLTKPADADKLSDAAQTQFARQSLPERAFALCFDGEYNYRKATPEIVK